MKELINNLLKQILVRKWIWVSILLVLFALLFADVVILNLKLANANKRLQVAEGLLAEFAKGKLPLIQTGEKSYQPIIPLMWQSIKSLEELRLKFGNEASPSADKFELK